MNNNSNPSPSKSEYPERYGYILHLWNSHGYWRASLENLETGKRSGFENLEQLFIYLMELAEGNLPERQTAGSARANESQKGITSCGCSSTNSIKIQ